MVREGDGLANLIAYIDGELITTTSLATGLGFEPGTRIGNRKDTDANLGWIGGIDEVALFARAFHQADVTALYNVALVPEPGTPGLLALGALCLLGCGWRKRGHWPDGESLT